MVLDVSYSRVLGQLVYIYTDVYALLYIYIYNFLYMYVLIINAVFISNIV